MSIFWEAANVSIEHGNSLFIINHEGQRCQQFVNGSWRAAPSAIGLPRLAPNSMGLPLRATFHHSPGHAQEAIAQAVERVYILHGAIKSISGPSSALPAHTRKSDVHLEHG
jgi:hypothetical protein